VLSTDVIGFASLAISLVSLIVVAITLLVVARTGGQTITAIKDVSKATTRVQEETGKVQEATRELGGVVDRVSGSITREARIQRIEAVLDVLVEMREMVNDHDRVRLRQTSEDQRHAMRLDCLAIARKLEVRLVFYPDSTLVLSHSIAEVREFDASKVEDALVEAKRFLKEQYLWT
jgi:hypothetical protein